MEDQNFLDRVVLQKIRNSLNECDAIIIGAGAGLSTSAGFTYSGERFQKHFADFGQHYGFSDMYSGGFYPYQTPEEHWAYWSRYVLVNRYMDAPKNTYQTLLALVQSKNYFVITTNVDHCFQKAGFDKRRLYYTQGDYGLFQCSLPCHAKTYDNESQIKEMCQRQKNMKIPSELIPRCPVCRRPMSMNLRSDDTFIQDEGWYAAAQRYENFLNAHLGKKILFLELGVGGNTPGIIKYPFWNMTLRHEHAIYACINLGEVIVPPEIARQSLCLSADIDAVLRQLLSF